MKKKILLIALVWVVTALSAAGQDMGVGPQNPTDSGEIFGAKQDPSVVRDQYGTYRRWIESVDGGVLIPASPLASKYYNPGIGGDITVGYRFDRNFSLSADLGYYFLKQNASSGESGQWNYVPLMALIRYTFGSFSSGPVHPYVLLGLGAAFNNYSPSVSAFGQTSNGLLNQGNLLICPGLGVLCKIDGETALFLQTRLDMNFVTSRNSVSAYADSPTLFIPIKAGLIFFIL
jgi:hypothetical protein